MGRLSYQDGQADLQVRDGQSFKMGLGLLVEGSFLEGIWAFAGSNEDRLFPGPRASGECEHL